MCPPIFPRRSRISTPLRAREHPQDIPGLLAQTTVIRSACALDLLMFLHRHPRALLTSDRLASFVGYDVKQVVQSVEAFIDAGILERILNPTHAARLYVLVFKGSEGEALQALLEIASTRQGRLSILDALDSAYGKVKKNRSLKFLELSPPEDRYA
jgi:hypothetical protein